MSTTHEVAWCAGFFDGEGFVTIGNRKTKINGKEYLGHYLRIGINHVAPEPLYEMQRVLGGKCVYDKSSEKPGKDGHSRKPRWKWFVNTSEAMGILKRMMPYLKNKNKVAELALDFQSSMITNKRLGVSKELYEFRNQCQQKLKALNAKD